MTVKEELLSKAVKDLGYDLDTATAKLDSLRNENDVLRGLVAIGQGPCIYCKLPAEDMGKCASGFPGCGRMDDIMNRPEKEAETKLLSVRDQCENIRMATIILAGRIEELMTMIEEAKPNA